MNLLPLLTRRRTNFCTNYNKNPSLTTNMAKGGDAASTLTTVDDATELANAGLTPFGPNVFKLDNSAGSTTAYVDITCNALAAVRHTLSAWVRGSGTGRIQTHNVSAGSSSAFPSTYTRRAVTMTPSGAGDKMELICNAGGVLYFVMTQAERGNAATRPIETKGAEASAIG